jgi:hypothetical protein
MNGARDFDGRSIEAGRAIDDAECVALAGPASDQRPDPDDLARPLCRRLAGDAEEAAHRASRIDRETQAQSDDAHITPD